LLFVFCCRQLKVMNNKLFSIEPKKGRLSPGESSTVTLTYKHCITGTDRLPVVFKLSRGREILVRLFTPCTTPWAIKTWHFILDHNSHVSWWIFTVLVSVERGINALQRNYTIYIFSLTVSLHYLIKLNTHKPARFKVNCHSILLLNSKNESMSYVSCFLQVVRLAVF